MSQEKKNDSETHDEMSAGDGSNEQLEKRKEDIADLVKRAKGEDRSYSAYAAAAGISGAAMSKIVHGGYIPTPNTIRQLTSIDADPRGGVTYYDLMEVAGYYNTMGGEDEERSKLQRESFERSYEFEKKCSLQLYDVLVNRGTLFRKIGADTSKISQIDLTIELIDNPIKRWMFYFKRFKDRIGGRPIMGTEDMLLSKSIRFSYTEDNKYSFVINDSSLFKALKKKEHALPIRGELSVVLFDEESDTFVEECYLSNYNEGDESKEIYLV